MQLCKLATENMQIGKQTKKEIRSNQDIAGTREFRQGYIKQQQTESKK